MTRPKTGVLAGAEKNFRTVDTQAAAAKARSIIMEVEKSRGYDPIDRELEKLG